MENVNKEFTRKARITASQEAKILAILKKQKTTFSKWLRKTIDNARVR